MLNTLPLLERHAPVIEPRPYQVEAVQATFDNWQQRPSSAQIIVAPTGSGKTLLAGMAASRHLEEVQGGRVLVLTHVQELVSQNYTTFRQMFPALSSGVYAASLGRKDKRAKVTFAMVQSVARQTQLFLDTSLLIIDEAHLIPHSGDGQYRMVINAIREARGADFLKILGLTATPYRLNSGNLLEPFKDDAPLFDEVAFDIDMLDLLEQGHLSKVVTRAAKSRMDIKGIHKRMGEYREDELDAKFNTDAKNRAIAAEIVEAGVEQDRKAWLVFCITVNHAERMRDMIRTHSVAAEMICGETPAGERQRLVRDFKQGKLRCLCSVNVLSTGFDHKGVDLVAMARPTASPGLYLQQAGRALRVSPGKQDALLLDFAANVFRHGLLTNVRGVHKRKKDGEEEAEAGVKECPACNAVLPSGVKTCSECGHEFPARAQVDREEKLFKGNQAAKVMDDAGTWMEVLEANFRETIGRNDKPGVLLLRYQVAGEQRQIECTEALCFDHGGWAAKKAHQLWKSRTGQYAPLTVAEAVGRIGELRRPSHVRVMRSDCGKYWNVRGVRF